MFLKGIFSLSDYMKDYSNYSDIELVALLKEDSQLSNHAFNAIYNKYSSRINGYCIYKSYSREESEELFQDTWLNFYKSIKSGKSTNKIMPYLFTIARNLSIDNYRKKKTKKIININFVKKELIEQLADPFNFEHDFEKEELSNLIKLAINYLDDIYKETVTLYWFGDLTYKEIAEICNETESCIRTRLNRAFKLLAKTLKPYLVESNKRDGE